MNAHSGALVAADLAPRASKEITLADLLPMGLTTEPRCLLAAAPGMATRRLVGGETIRLTNLEAGRTERVLQLPRVRPSMRMRPPGCGWFELEPQIDTLVIRPDDRELSVVYSAKLRVAGRYPDDELAQVQASISWRQGAT